MHFDLDDDERALQAAIRDLCRARVPAGKLADQESGLDRRLWRELGGAGVFGLRLPEEEGGTGLGLTQAVIVFGELGRALIPGPLVATHLAADLLPGAATGHDIVGLLETGSPPLLVEHLDDLDVLLVVDGDGITACKPVELDADPIARPLDPLTAVHALRQPPVGERLAGREVAAAWQLHGTVLTAALLVGAAQATTDLAASYARQREQFGKPIGAFQAVKHLCADMLVRTEVARAAVHAAGVLVDDADEGGTRAAHAAKVLASEAAIANGKACIQVHGGMGFTWEVDVHRYLKRAVVWSTHFGAADAHAEAIAHQLGGSIP